ncbi:MAG: XRE family transcriptional regulator [Dehalogenimonas sp.]|uniref:XRE family transcriptional regulator n=1 Tax=Candidatus Dehalogenimonas loeffleri TaxID=3127115 RepID=A0ABZ2J1X9_9CHLR|nr:XRE family transcriptional regulator [Dehalogenimonas sp.]
MKQEIPINPNMLKWARLQAKLTPTRAAFKAGMKAGHGANIKTESLSPALRLESWENGIETPTFSQLKKLAHAYRRTVLTFFLTAPPKKERGLVDFRVFGKYESAQESFEAEFSALIRRIEGIQKITRDLLISSNTPPLGFIGTAKTSLSPKSLAVIIREYLGFEPTGYIKSKTIDGKLNLIRQKAESKGIFVIFQGNLGSYHTDFAPEVFRGFTLSDPMAPFVVINPNDTKTANIFTLIHELTHLWLGDACISNTDIWSVEAPSEKPSTEKFCDLVASEFLVPEDAILKDWELFTIGYDNDAVIRRIAKLAKVSPIVVAIKLFQLNKISSSEYWRWYDAYQEEWKQIKEFIQEKRKRKKDSGPGYNKRMKYALGSALLHTISSAARDGLISEIEVSGLIRVKIDAFNQVFG